MPDTYQVLHGIVFSTAQKNGYVQDMAKLHAKSLDWLCDYIGDVICDQIEDRLSQPMSAYEIHLTHIKEDVLSLRDTTHLWQTVRYTFPFEGKVFEIHFFDGYQRTGSDTPTLFVSTGQFLPTGQPLGGYEHLQWQSR